MLLYDTHRVEQAEQDPWYKRRKRGGKNSRRPIPAEDVNSTGAFRSIPPVPLDTQRTAFEQREAVAQVQNALGVPRKQIAQELGVSEATVRRYLRTPEQRAESAARAQRQLYTAETARQAATQRHELERAERAQRHQVRLSVRALYDTRPHGRRSSRHTRNHTIPSRKIHNGIRRQIPSRQVEKRSTGRDGASPASRRPQAPEKTAARQSPAGGQELEQVASTAQASHTATTLRTRGAVLLVSSLKADVPYGLAKGLSAAPEQEFRQFTGVWHRPYDRTWET